MRAAEASVTNPEPQYCIEIKRLVANPEYAAQLKSGRQMYGDNRIEPWLEQTVTVATLSAEQWLKVQAAIIEAHK